jgi:thiol-disulfide isomerase/thioredoxin
LYQTTFGQKTCFNKDSVLSYQKAIYQDSVWRGDRVNLAFLQGCPFPEYGFNQLNEEILKISSLKGQLVFVNFWFKSCEPCIEEMPTLVKLSEKYSKKNVKFINVSTDQKSDLETYIMAHSMPGILQTYQNREILLDNYAATFGYPMYFLIGKNGNIIKAWTGSYTSKELHNLVKNLIEENL